MIPILNQGDFEKLAEQAANAFHEAGTPLNDSILKIASEMGLNPSQIKNLVWTTNVKTHLDLFDKKADDKVVEFPVADPSYILSCMYKTPDQLPLPEKTAESVAVDFYTSPVTRSVEKTAAFVPEEKEVSAKTAAERRAHSVINARKIAAEIENKRLDAYENILPRVEKLAYDIRKLGFDVNEFEKDAFAMYEDSALPVINWLRQYRHAEPVTSEKVACSYERVIDTDSPEIKLFSEIVESTQELQKYAKALNWVNEKFAAALK